MTCGADTSCGGSMPETAFGCMATTAGGEVTAGTGLTGRGRPSVGKGRGRRTFGPKTS